jgi:hypothetical protein
MRGCIITETGWSWEQVNALDISRGFELMNYWAKYPTPSMILRAYFKVQPSTVECAVRQETFEEDFSAVQLMAGSALPTMRIPKQYRDAITWAENLKGQLGSKN